MDGDFAGGAGVFILILIAGLLYFLPCFVASNRSHKNSNSIFILNLFLGWTFLGWLAALIWSSTAATIPTDTKAPAPSRSKECPFCAETIKLEAIVCRYCSKDLPKKAKIESIVPSSSQAPDDYIPIEEFARHKNIDEKKILKMIREGFYNGHIFDELWYVHKTEL